VRCFRRAHSFLSFHFWRRLVILDLAGSYIGNQFSELVRVPRTLLAFRSSGHQTLSLLYSPSKMLFASSHPSSQISRSSLSAGYGQSSRGMLAPYASMPCPKISEISIILLHAFYGSEACKAANFKMTHYRQSTSISPTNTTPEANSDQCANSSEDATGGKDGESKI
jgi:hypothetical protein